MLSRKLLRIVTNPLCLPKYIAERGVRKCIPLFERVLIEMRSFSNESIADLQSRVCKDNAKWNNIHAGKRAFIIGNGASLSKIDLTPLTDEITFVVNSFFKHPLCHQVSPKYWCLLDPAFFLHKGVQGSANDQLAELNACSKTVTYLVPWIAKESIESGQLPRDRSVTCGFGRRLQDGIKKPIKLDSALPMVLNVSQFALMCAIALGCNPIILLGMDHDFGVMQHFYDSKVAGAPKGNIRQVTMCSSVAYQQASIVFKGYGAIQKYCADAGIDLLNATDGGFLDVFPRVDYMQSFA